MLTPLTLIFFGLNTQNRTILSRDLLSLSSILWPRPQTLEEYWASDAGVEFLEKWFSVAKIAQYFRSRSPPPDGRICTSLKFLLSLSVRKVSASTREHFLPWSVFRNLVRIVLDLVAFS
jgi:hypothetical protein